jgi:choline dehydrogenase-like flavoprotein
MPESELNQNQKLEWIRNNLSFYYHMVGTCKMGIEKDESAVVDYKGLVRGFKNLYIFDASIMPRIPRGMLNLTVFAMAEKLVENFMKLKGKTF